MTRLNYLSSWFRNLTHRKRFKKRYDVLNYFARLRNCKSYLEIGTATGRCLQRVGCSHKVGVDPSPRAEGPEWQVWKMTSDSFFAANRSKFDLVLIDGLHLAGQVLRDIYNSLDALNRGGVIALHDCNPSTEEAQLPDESLAEGNKWNGDVWKAIAYVKKYEPGLFCQVLDLDHGVGVIIPRDYERRPALTAEIEEKAQSYFDSLSWHDLQKNRGELLGLIDNREDLQEELERQGLAAPRG